MTDPVHYYLVPRGNPTNGQAPYYVVPEGSQIKPDFDTTKFGIIPIGPEMFTTGEPPTSKGDVYLTPIGSKADPTVGQVTTTDKNGNPEISFYVPDNNTFPQGAHPIKITAQMFQLATGGVSGGNNAPPGNNNSPGGLSLPGTYTQDTVASMTNIDPNAVRGYAQPMIDDAMKTLGPFLK